METAMLIKRLENYFREKGLKPEIIQTHISVVFLAGKYAYKIKKPVNFGFLDFSTLNKRKLFCTEEVKLNKRLSKIYLGVARITEDNNVIEINGKGKTIEYAVVMKRMPQGRLMSEVIQKRSIKLTVLDSLATKLSAFYRKSRLINPGKYSSIRAIRFNTDENFRQTKKYIGKTITKTGFEKIMSATNRFYEENRKLFSERAKQTVDGHGDLHLGNIFLDKKRIEIFDCIEFNKRFRFGDVASDVAFLAMDLDFLGKGFYSAYFINSFARKSSDSTLLKVIDFYKMYRAYVKGKVTSFMLDDKSINPSKKAEIRKKAKAYFALAENYANKISSKKRLAFVVYGLTGSGKTRKAKIIAKLFNAERISSDETRKKLAGVSKYSPVKEAFGRGIYSKEFTEKTYRAMLNSAKEALKSRNVVIDAMFSKQWQRRMIAQLSGISVFVPVYVYAGESTIRSRLKARKGKKKIETDGRLEIYKDIKSSFENPFVFGKTRKIITISTEAQEPEQLNKIFYELLGFY